MPRIVLTNSAGRTGIRTAVETLKRGRPALDAVERGIRRVETDTRVHSVGRGGWPNLLGEVELDASIMDGRTRHAGAVGALKGFLHPISVARKVMEELPHVLLVGEGAARFASEWRMEKGENLTTEAEAAWKSWLEANLDADGRTHWPEVPLSPLSWRTADPATAGGTTVFLVHAGDKDLAAGVSTSGWAWKHPGRLGDSPLIGAGMYVDSRYGAAACTGHGELMIRTGAARSIVLYMKMGFGVRDACHEALNDVGALGKRFRGSAMVYAIDRNGRSCVLGYGGECERRYWVWTDAMDKPVHREPALVPD